MIRTLYVYAFLLIIAVPAAMAQQDPQFSLYMYNPLYYNPAAAGSEGVSRIQLTHRTQYLGYQAIGSNDNGAQSTQLISYNMPLDNIKSGIGIYGLNDKLGAVRNQAVQLSYAYRMTLKNGTLAIGVQAGLFSKGYNYGELRPGEVGDPLIPTGTISQARPDFGAGIYYNTTDYWVGVSMNHINEATYNVGTDRSTNPLNRNMYLTAGYRLGLGYNIDVQPSILVQYTTPSQGNVTFNLTGTYDNRIWAGVGYRYQDAIMANVGINLMRNNALRVGYCLDIVTGRVKSPTSHELLVSYALPTIDTRKKPIIRTPRFRY
ncbi:hypothetical protein GCM10027592_33820 [Spirosoma flavus]